MFTGLIAELGRITAIEKGESSAVFSVSAPALISQIALGDSVAVNGVCLTATSITGDSFTADVMVQTLAVTSLSQLGVGSPVNLELAALLNTRMGGHMVQGHVDGVATVVVKSKDLDVLVEKHNELGINHVFVEAGPTLGSAMLDCCLLDELIMYQAPTLLGTGKHFFAFDYPTTITDQMRMDHLDTQVLDGDVKSVYRIRNGD